MLIRDVIRNREPYSTKATATVQEAAEFMAARNIGAVPILMLEARLVERDNTAQEKARISYDYVLLTHDALCTAFEKQDEIIYDVGRQKNLHVIDATQQLSGRGEFFETSVHVKPTGSERLARLVADDLAKILRADVQR